MTTNHHGRYQLFFGGFGRKTYYTLTDARQAGHQLPKGTEVALYDLKNHSWHSEFTSEGRPGE